MGKEIKVADDPPPSEALIEAVKKMERFLIQEAGVHSEAGEEKKVGRMLRMAKVFDGLVKDLQEDSENS